MHHFLQSLPLVKNKKLYEEGIKGSTFAAASATKEDNLKFNKFISSELHVRQACKIHKYSSRYLLFIQGVWRDLKHVLSGFKNIRLGSLEKDPLFFTNSIEINQATCQKAISIYVTFQEKSLGFTGTVLF